MTNPPQLYDPTAKIQPAGAVDADDGPVRIDSVRTAFYDEVQERCFIFARDLLTLIPELESVAVVPAYVKTTEGTPAAVLVGREGPPKTAIEVMHLSAQMQRAKVHLENHAGEYLRYMGQESAEGHRRLHAIRGELEVAQKELERLNAELAKCAEAATAERPTPSGVAPESLESSGDPEVGSLADR